VARVASVIGWEFDHALLAEVVPSDVDLRPAIAAVEAAGLIQQTTAGRTIAYRFTHALTQDVCYDSLVGHQRKALHGAIGRALASTHPERMDERDALLAHHFSRAEDWPSAILFGRRAAERAIALSQFGDAMVALDQVIEWARHLPDRQHHVVADLLLQQGRVCETLGLRARQQQLIDQLIDHLAHEEGSARLAEVYLRQGDLSTLLQRFDAADRRSGPPCASARSAATRRWSAAPFAASAFFAGTKAGMRKRSTSPAASSPRTGNATTRSQWPAIWPTPEPS
jgi:predicted ATPase